MKCSSHVFFIDQNRVFIRHIFSYHLQNNIENLKLQSLLWMKPLSICLLCFKTPVGFVKGNTLQSRGRRKDITHTSVHFEACYPQLALLRIMKWAKIISGWFFVVVIAYVQFKSVSLHCFHLFIQQMFVECLLCVRFF